MIKEAIEYIVGLSKPSTITIGDAVFSDRELKQVYARNHAADPIMLNTLSGLVDYIDSGYDEMQDTFISIDSHECVRLYSPLDQFRNREILAIVRAEHPTFIVREGYQTQEEFIIGLQSKFVPTEDRDLLLKFAGTVEHGTVSNYSDDGVTQKATIKTGITSKSSAIVPNTVRLSPYRTFIEVEQPESEFIFRMKEENGKVLCGLFEADGGAWKIEAKRNIKEYLEKELSVFKDSIGIVILS